MYTDSLTINERERIAYCEGDHKALALIYAGEDYFEGEVSPEHEAVIDDRNRLRDSLNECVAQMSDAVAQLDELNARDEPIADDEKIEHDPAFLDAIEDAKCSLGMVESQYDETLREKLAIANRDLEALHARRAADEQRLRAADEVVRCLVYLTRDYTGRKAKPAPKWAQHAIQVQQRIGEVRQSVY